MAAADPQRLIHKWEEHRRQLDELVPDLRAMHRGMGIHPRVRFFEGSEGVLSVLHETLKARRPLLGILSMRDLLDVPGEAAMARFISERVRQGVQLRVVRSRQKEADPDWGTNAAAFREVRYAPADQLFTMTMLISGDTVALLSSRRENFALTIQSAKYADLQENLFEVLWGASTPT